MVPTPAMSRADTVVAGLPAAGAAGALSVLQPARASAPAIPPMMARVLRRIAYTSVVLSK
jgi:hypothetical protein